MKEFTDRFIMVLVLVISAACVTGLLVDRCSEPEPTPKPPEGEVVKLYLHDTVYVDRPTEIRTVYMPVPEFVDTAEILEKYFCERVYRDTIKPNEYVTITVTDTVYMNQLVRQNLDVVTIPKLVYRRRGGLGSGIRVGKNLLQFNADIEINRSNIAIGYDIINQTPTLGYSHKFVTW